MTDYEAKVAQYRGKLEWERAHRKRPQKIVKYLQKLRKYLRKMNNDS